MKRPVVFILVAILASGCAVKSLSARGLSVSFTFNRQPGYGSNQYAIWIEDTSGAVTRTLFATRFIAKGGYKFRPDALRGWVAAAKPG